MISSANKVVAVREKDIKKVAAGRAGAAARKAKQDRLLSELRSAKETLHITTEALSKQTEAPSPALAKVADTKDIKDINNAADIKDIKDINTNKPTISDVSLTPWIVGGVLVAVAIILGRTRRDMGSRQEIVGREKIPVKTHIDLPLPAAQQLKVTPNPLHME